MRVAFMGTPELAAMSLRALLASAHPVVAVVSQPDRKAGRGRRLQAPPVARLARDVGLPLVQPARVGTRELRRWLAEAAPDVIVVAAYGHILGPRLLQLAPRGCLNVHASLLPRWRGASPIQQAILAGDSVTGVTIMQMDAGLDTGPMLAKAEVPIDPDTTGATLHDRLAEVGAALLVDTLDRMDTTPLSATPQPDVGVTYAPILKKSDGDVDWTRPAVEIERAIRAFHPWPGTRTRWMAPDAKEPIWLKLSPPARVLDVPAPADAPRPGSVRAAGPEGIVVQTGEGALALQRLQAPGGRPLDAASFLAGHAIPVGAAFG